MNSLNPTECGFYSREQKFAGEGLRTLCLAYKDIDEGYFDQWMAKHHAASITLENREEAVDAVYEEIEQNLILIGENLHHIPLSVECSKEIPPI